MAFNLDGAAKKIQVFFDDVESETESAAMRCRLRTLYLMKPFEYR